MKTVAIIGGGITGLTAAYRLEQDAKRKKLGIQPVLLESAGRLGGKILSEKVAGTVFEGGPDSFLTVKPHALDLIFELGLGPELLPTNSRQQDVYVFTRGKLRKLPEGMFLMAPAKIFSFLRSDLISWPGKIRMAFDFFLPRGKQADESMGAFARRRFGIEAVKTIVQPIMAGIYAGDADQLSLKSTFPRFLELEQKYRSVIRGLRRSARKRPQNPQGITAFMSLREGLQQLVGALERRLDRDRLRLGAHVAGISRLPDGYRVELASGEPIDCAAVILAAPASGAARVVGKMDPRLSEMLDEIPFSSTATVSLLFNASDVKGVPPGFGFVSGAGEAAVVSAGTFTSIKFPDRVAKEHFLVRCFLGGAGKSDFLDWDDARVIAEVRMDLRRIAGINAQPATAKVYRWPRANPQYTVGHGAKLARIDALLKDHPGLFLAGASYYGVGIPDCIASGTEAAHSAMKFLV